MPLAEIVPGEFTSKDTIEKVYNFWEELDKVPVILNKEVRGYAHNRLYFLMLREALDMVGKGVISADDMDKVLTYSMGVRFSALRSPMLSLYMKGKAEKTDIKGFETESCLEHYSRILPGYWKTYATWDELPYKIVKNVVKSVSEMEAVKKEVSEENLHSALLDSLKTIKKNKSVLKKI
jgi:ketoreductase RED1